jgi:glycine/D-amino acid oxidase-like deaminating enzyme
MLRSGEVLWTNPGYDGFPAADGRIECDYLIVGGGIAGVMTAYLLSKETQASVVLIEKDGIGSGATGASAGMIVREFEGVSFENLVSRFGARGAQSYWNAHTDMYDELKDIIRRERIQCDLREGDIYIVAKSPEEERAVRSDAALRTRLGISAVQVAGGEIRSDITVRGYEFGERVERGLSINPVKLVQNLASVAAWNGVRIYENSEVTKFGGGIAYTEHAEIRFGSIIKMTDSYGPENPVDRFRTSVAATRQLTEGELRNLGLEDFDMIIESNLRGYHYLKVTHDRRILIGFGDELVLAGDKKHAPISEHVRNMEHFARDIFPDSDLEFEYLWTGTYGLGRDAMPYLSFLNKNVTMCGAGLQLTSMVMARHVVSKLLGKSSMLDRLY